MHEDLMGHDLDRIYGGAASGILYRDLQLSNDQILALPTTPVQIVAAPGEASMLLLHAALFMLDFRTGSYTNLPITPAFPVPFVALGSSSVQLSGLLAPAASPFGNNDLQWFYTGALSVVDTQVGQPDAPVSTALYAAGSSTWANQPLLLATNNESMMPGIGGGNFTGGNAANTLSVRVWYSVVPALPFGA